jgi:hypothetical protein
MIDYPSLAEAMFINTIVQTFSLLSMLIRFDARNKGGH